MKKLLVILVALIGFGIAATSCSKMCRCEDRNTGYEYPDIDIDGKYKNCRELQDAANSSGDAVRCWRV